MKFLFLHPFSLIETGKLQIVVLQDAALFTQIANGPLAQLVRAPDS